MQLLEDNLLSLYPNFDSILGPYTRKDGREHIVLNNTNLPKGSPNKTKTISYPKAIVESQIARRLKDNETIDHNDRDKNNHSGRNLVIRDRALHASLDSLRVKIEEVNCVECGNSFIPSRNQHDSRSLNRDGPFCSKHCSGLYLYKLKRGGEKKDRVAINKTYYKVQK